ncbi:hypothetical protein [Pontibacter sp. SGAir0037]|uniref:hypothetical protein n=1 Tax=Pontibacter sp. SGAir0037 TaxID=2571030 RepID=UPI0010CCE34A|nr:hypothetical protein [Pontibacter sp. SGAir0037]QCR21664.1 hypothetical protein C1N53_04435 [Pontibacter sp. SGAir0037]
MQQYFCTTGRLAALLLFLALGFTAQAQTQPDTVRRKTELPTGPTPVPVERTPQQTRPIPPVQTPPPVAAPVEQTAGAEERPTLMDRLYTGGGFGLQFGYYTNISLSPILGYMATDKFWFGGGLVYQYQSIRLEDYYTGRPAGRVSMQNYGVKFFVQQEFLNLEESFLGGRILAHGEYEILSLQLKEQDSFGNILSSRRTEDTPLLGLGYRQRLGGRGASADLYFLYNLSNSPYTPYSNPVIRFGFNIPLGRGVE